MTGAYLVAPAYETKVVEVAHPEASKAPNSALRLSCVVSRSWDGDLSGWASTAFTGF